MPIFPSKLSTQFLRYINVKLVSGNHVSSPCAHRRAKHLENEETRGKRGTTLKRIEPLINPIGLLNDQASFFCLILAVNKRPICRVGDHATARVIARSEAPSFMTDTQLFSIAPTVALWTCVWDVVCPLDAPSVAFYQLIERGKSIKLLSHVSRNVYVAISKLHQKLETKFGKGGNVRGIVKFSIPRLSFLEFESCKDTVIDECVVLCNVWPRKSTTDRFWSD